MANDVESCLVGGSLYTALRLSRFHGVAPIDLKPLGNFHVARFSKSSVLYSWLLFTVVSVAVFVGIIMDMQFYGTSKGIGVNNISSVLSWFCQIMMTKIIIVGGLYDVRTRMKKLFRFLKQIEKVHKDMRCDLTQQFNDKHESAVVIWLLVTSYISQIMYYPLYTHTTIEQKIILCLYGIYSIENSMALLLLMQVACFVVRLHSAFKQINKRLRELMDIQELNIRRSIRDISTAYVQLCSVVRNVNDQYGFMIFVILTATASSIFINTYHLLLVLCLPDVGGQVRQLFTIIMIVLTILSYFIQIIILIEPCHRIHEEMEETNVLLNKVTFHLTPIGHTVMGELEVFHMQVKLCKTAFSPLGVYILQRSLTATVISSLVTFIVFIKQYHIIVECN